MKALKPAVFIPTLYFIDGLPYALVVYASVIFYKNLGESLEFIGVATSCFYLPWVLKFAWAPLVDLIGYKKAWIVAAQLLLTVLCLLFMPALFTPQRVIITLCAFSIMAFISATQDIALDGYYLEVLNKEQQSYFVGVRSAVYKMAILFGSSLLISIIGWLNSAQHMTMTQAWAVGFGVCAVLCLCGCTLHHFGIPKTEKIVSDNPELDRPSFKTFVTVFVTFFQQDRIGWIVLYILTFRLGDAFVLKMANPFLLDDIAKGGLGMNNEQLGFVGGVGVTLLLVGGLVGGFVVSKFGLKRSLMPSAIIQNSTILLYYYLAQFRPGLMVVAVFNAIEQFAYGLGTAAYMVFLLSTVKSKYKAGHYAVATAMMALGIMLPGLFSGYMASALGYKTFFLVSFLAAIPGMITILLLPLEDTSTVAAKT